MKKLIVPVLALVLLGGACSRSAQQTQQPGQSSSGANSSADSATMTEGQRLSNGRCTGNDKPQLTHLPMNAADFSHILPYGLMVGGHVTPIDHQYFSPTNFQSPPDTYDVFAMADSHIVDIGTRQHAGFGANANQTVTDYRIVFAMSCKILYYYDLVTSLTPELKAIFDQQGHSVDIPVTAGQKIGKIGGQTLDFAVWDMDVNLPGFITPSLYTSESWKLHTADPLLYETEEVKAASLAKYARSVEPRSGKIDFDVDGKAIGNWFQVGTNGYGGLSGEGPHAYWTGHLSLAPYFLDPSAFLVSIGNWPGEASQFATKETTPNPADISVETGLVKYNLVQWRDYLANGQQWDNMSTPKTAVTLHRLSEIQGCLLVQMTAPRALKAEAFKGKSCSAVNGFDTNAVMYER